LALIVERPIAVNTIKSACEVGNRTEIRNLQVNEIKKMQLIRQLHTIASKTNYYIYKLFQLAEKSNSLKSKIFSEKGAKSEIYKLMK